MPCCNAQRQKPNLLDLARCTCEAEAPRRHLGSSASGSGSLPHPALEDLAGQEEALPGITCDELQNAASEPLAQAMLLQANALTSLVGQLASGSADPFLEAPSSSSGFSRREALKIQADLALRDGSFFDNVLSAATRRMDPAMMPGTLAAAPSRDPAVMTQLERFGGYPKGPAFRVNPVAGRDCTRPLCSGRTKGSCVYRCSSCCVHRAKLPRQLARPRMAFDSPAGPPEWSLPGSSHDTDNDTEATTEAVLSAGRSKASCHYARVCERTRHCESQEVRVPKGKVPAKGPAKEGPGHPRPRPRSQPKAASCKALGSQEGGRGAESFACSRPDGPCASSSRAGVFLECFHSEEPPPCTALFPLPAPFPGCFAKDFPDRDPHSSRKARLTSRLVDRCVHVCCMAH